MTSAIRRQYDAPHADRPGEPLATSAPTKILAANLLPKERKQEIVNAINGAETASEITISCRQFSIRIEAIDGIMLSLQMFRKDDSTVWVDYLPVKIGFENIAGSPVENLLKARILSAVNNFCLLPGPYTISSQPLTHSHAAVGVEADFLVDAKLGFNLQEAYSDDKFVSSSIHYTPGPTPAPTAPAVVATVAVADLAEQTPVLSGTGVSKANCAALFDRDGSRFLSAFANNPGIRQDDPAYIFPLSVQIANVLRFIFGRPDKTVAADRNVTPDMRDATAGLFDTNGVRFMGGYLQARNPARHDQDKVPVFVSRRLGTSFRPTPESLFKSA